MKYFFAILIVAATLYYWLKPSDDAIYRGDGGHTLSDAEKVYYLQSFNYAMSMMPEGQQHTWESYNGKGTLAPRQLYASKSKANCRPFSETFTIGGYEGSQEGIACKRKGKEGWCRVKAGNPETCALEDKSIALNFGGLNLGTIDIGSINIGGVDINIDAPSTGGIGGVGTPDMPDTPKEKPSFLPKFEGRKDGQTSADWLIQ
jgi:surface antigen